MTRYSEKILLWEPEDETDRPYIALIIGSEKSLLFDAGNSPRHAKQIKNDCIALLGKEPDFIGISHKHPDHWFGLNEFHGSAFGSIKMIKDAKELRDKKWTKDEVEKRVKAGEVHPMTARMLDIEYGMERSTINLRIPEIGIEKRVGLNLGNTECIFEYVGGNHSDDSSVLFVPDERILFLGDILYVRTNDHEVVSELEKTIMKYDANYYIDSHRLGVMDKAEMKKALEELKKG